MRVQGEMDAKTIAKRLTVQIKIHRMNQWRWRVMIGIWLMRLAALVIGAISKWRWKMSEWTSVEDSLPGKDTWVLAFAKDKGQHIASVSGVKSSYWVDDSINRRRLDVTHWMFIPDPSDTGEETPDVDEPVLSPVDMKSVDQWTVELRLETDTCGDCIKHLSESCPEHTVVSHSQTRIQVDPISSHVTCRGFERWQRNCTCNPDARVSCPEHRPEM